MLAIGLMVVALLGPTGVALAEPNVSLDPAPDGTLILVGSGWRPGQRMVVSVGSDLFPVLADAVGEFEVQTSLVSTGGPPEPLAVHSPSARTNLEAIGPPRQPDVPHSFAVLFAQSVMTGTACVGLLAAGLGFSSLAARSIRTRRRGSSFRTP